MHSNDGHGIQPHITFHFQLFALFLRISSVCGRVFLNLTGGDPVLSDDLAQETFIKVYYNLRSYKGLSSFSTWIYRVAYNVFYDELRKSREWEDASVDEAANLLEQPPERVDRNIDISRALSILRPEERTAITLFFVEDLAVAKIAEIMSISEGTVKSHLFRAKQKLGEYLKKNGYE